jgi:hypothetical protein
VLEPVITGYLLFRTDYSELQQNLSGMEAECKNSLGYLKLSSRQVTLFPVISSNDPLLLPTVSANILIFLALARNCSKSKEFLPLYVICYLPSISVEALSVPILYQFFSVYFYREVLVSCSEKLLDKMTYLIFFQVRQRDGGAGQHIPPGSKTVTLLQVAVKTGQRIPPGSKTVTLLYVA